MQPLSLKAIAALCAAGSVLSISAVAVAQDGPPGGPGWAGPHAARHGDREGPGRGPGFRHGDPAARTKRLHDLLQITKLYTVFDIYDDEASAIASFK